MSRIEQLHNLYTLATQENVNYYEVFSLQTDCNEKDIKKAYRKLSMICHPDNFVSESQDIQSLADDCSNIVNKMYATLSDPIRRSYYNDHGTDLDEKDIELAKKERQSKEFIEAIFSKLEKREKYSDGAVKQTIPPKLIYHGGAYTFKYDDQNFTLNIPKGTLPMSAFTLKNVLGGEGVPVHLKGDLTVMCVHGSTKGCKIDKLDVTITTDESDIKYNDENLPIKVKVLGSWVDVSKAVISKNKKGNMFRIDGYGLQNQLFTAKGNLIVELTK